MQEELEKKWVGGICINDGQVLLIHRVNKKQVFNSEYFIFPGEMVEEDQTIEQALLEEFKKVGITVAVEDLIYEHTEDETIEYYHLCRQISGRFEQTTREYLEEGHIQKFTPVWVRIKDLDDLIVYPETLKDKLITDYAS